MTDTLVEKAEAAVEGEVKKVEAAAEQRIRVEIAAEEKLVLRDAETEFLRAQVTIRDLQVQMKEASGKAEVATKKYSEQIETLVKKYTIDKATMIFDNIENVFKINPQVQAAQQAKK